MTANTERVGVIQLSEAQLHHPNLLTGLDSWLHLGLLSIPQVSQFCQAYLTCDVPVLVNPPVQSDLTSVAVLAEVPLTDFVAPEPSPAPVATSWLTRGLRALMAEIGVIWLLCLGVFMVVVSSGVLAASQWQNFSAVGQYGILFTYTLAFWGVGLWTSRQPALQLTTQMLQTATLLLIPINFWMMDGLPLWRSPIGIGVSLLAALGLTGMLWPLMRVLTQQVQHRTLALNLLGLSGLHWGWSIGSIPLIAAYAGTIGTAALTYLRQRLPQESTADQETAPAVLPTLVLTFALLLLLGRAVLSAQVPLAQLGLAFGICGWLFCWLTRRRPDAWTVAGVGLLLLGWTITIAADPPWQAFAISGLGLGLLADRVRRQATGLPALLLLGLQTYALLWRLLPVLWREAVLAQAVQLFGEVGLPLALLSLVGFPYLWLLLWFAQHLRQRQQRDLSSQTERIALVLGSIMLLLSPANSWVCALTLSGLALTLAAVLRQRNRSELWLYSDHLLILAALAAWIHTLFPHLSGETWAQVLLLGVAIEWGLSLGVERLWRQSCWHFGLALAGCSYLLLLNQREATALWHPNLVWLVVPILLTGLSRRSSSQPSPRLAAGLSTGSLLAQLVLLNTSGSWMISLAVAAALMLINTGTLQQPLAAFLTIGFGLGFEATALYHFFAAALTFERNMLILAANLWLLWLGQAALQRRPQALRQQYAAAANLWATGLALLSLLSLTLTLLINFLWEGAAPASGLLVLGGGLIALAIADQVRRNPSEVGYWGLAWAVELGAALLLDHWNGSFAALAVVTLAIGLAAQVAGDFWSQRHASPYRLSWHLIPLVYGALGLLLGHQTFTATTGLYTLAAALIGLGVGRRQAQSKPLTLASLLLVSVAAYELLIYQLSQATGGQVGDGMTLLAGLATAIAVGLRIGLRWLRPYLRLNSPDLKWVAHLHWGLGSGLALLALVLTVSRSGFWIWLLVAGSLTLYALVSGRLALAQGPGSAENWTTFGIAEGLTVLSYAMYRIAPNTSLLLVWAGLLAALVALGLYSLPWSHWGWPARPWTQMAIGFPAVIVVLTAGSIALQSLLIVAAFYTWIAKAEQRPRLSYLSLLLFNWAAIRYLNELSWLNLPWLSSLITGSLLYIAQIDPALQTTEARIQRHGLRLLAVGLLCLTLFYQAELEPQPAVLLRLLTLAFAVGLMLVGLVLRVRAFLYVGTLVFMAQVVRLLWLFINQYSLLLWAVGIVIGLLLIWIAATFEARRSQVSGLMQYWLDELATWE